MSKSIREMIKERSDELRGVSELPPDRVADILLELNSLNASLGEELVNAEAWYKERLKQERDNSKNATDAKINAEASKEHKDWRERKMMWDALQENIKSCKLFLRIKNEEYKNL